MAKDALATHALEEQAPTSLTKPSFQVPSPTTGTHVRVDREGRKPAISGSFAAFRDLALSLVAQLEDRRLLLARRRTLLSQALLAELEPMTAEAERLAKEFGSWPLQPPDVVRRSDTIQRLVDLQQQVLSYLDGDR
jgi:hypothetical protein